MYRLLPLLLLLAISPNSEKKLESLNSFVIAAKETVSSIRCGIDTFQTAMIPFMTGQESKKPVNAAPTEKEEDTDDDVQKSSESDFTYF